MHIHVSPCCMHAYANCPSSNVHFCFVIHRQRFSAPPGPDRGSGIRDSMTSMDYLSESQMDSDDEESAQSEVGETPVIRGEACTCAAIYPS